MLGGCAADGARGTAPAEDLVGYRDIRREDFRSTARPAKLPEHDFNAWSRLLIRPAEGFAVRTLPGDQPGQYQAAPHGLRFEAAFDRNDSWWNPDLTPAEAAYVLRHEQIHFMIEEIQARRLNQRLDEITRSATVTAATPKLAHDASMEQLLNVMREALAQTGAMHAAFDSAASNGFHDAAQEAWWERIRTEFERGAGADTALLEPANGQGRMPPLQP